MRKHGFEQVRVLYTFLGETERGQEEEGSKKGCIAKESPQVPRNHNW